MSDKEFKRISTALTLDPHTQENLVSYIFRLAAYRLLSSARMLLNTCKFDTFTNQPYPEWMAELANTACVEERDLWAISYGLPNRKWAMFRGQRVSQAVIEKHGVAERRICPACIDEIPVQRAIWDLLYVAICPAHRVVLMDVCPACIKPIRWLGADLTRCACSGKPAFSSFVAENAAPEDVGSTAAVYGLMGDRSFKAEADQVRSLPPFRDLAGANIVEFLYRLALERMGRLSKYFSSENPGDLVWEAHIALRRGLEAVTPRPSAFHLVIDEMRLRSNSSPAMSMRMAAGAVERWQARLPEGQGIEIVRAVREYWAVDRKRETGDG